MTNKQLKEIEKFARPFYLHLDHYHNWEHISLTEKYALLFAEQFQKVSLNTLKAICYLHDIGRSKKDEGHGQESVKLAVPFLKKIKITEDEINIIIDAIDHHDATMIKKAKTDEAKLLFDADKVQILSVAGFIGVALFLVEKRKMKLKDAIEFLWNYAQDVQKNYIQTKKAQKLVDKEMKTIQVIANSF